jgi:hypothetical protein
VFSLSLSAKYKTEELESFHTIDEAFIVLAPYMNNRFNCLLFTTENDITFKLNKKKRVGTIVTQAPTFKKLDVIIEMKEKDFCNSLRVLF